MGGWREEYVQIIENYDHLAAMPMHEEDLPQSSNRITLHAKKLDACGLPISLVHYE